MSSNANMRIKLMMIRCCSILLIVLFPPLAATLDGQTTNGDRLAGADTSQINLKDFAASIVKESNGNLDRAERLLTWLSSNFRWLSTDYKNRTVKEIIVRRGGNCFELATVYVGLIKTLGIRYRQIAEINIQPRSDERRKSAEELISKRGLSGSVFGEQHNDHRWVEVYDERSVEWIPADPSVGVIGLEPWLKSRVWFGERWAVDTSITNEMIVPIAIFVVDSTSKMTEDRSHYYLVESLNKLYGGRLSGLPSWKDWETGLGNISGSCKGAFEGKVNLHHHDREISKLAETYSQLREDFLNARK
jgi:hypothetical protein